MILQYVCLSYIVLKFIHRFHMGMKRRVFFYQQQRVKIPKLLCQEHSDSLGVSNGDFLAPTDAMADPNMAPAMGMADTTRVDTKVPAFIVAPATNLEGDTSATNLVMDPAMVVTNIMAPAMAVKNISAIKVSFWADIMSGLPNLKLQPSCKNNKLIG